MRRYLVNKRSRRRWYRCCCKPTVPYSQPINCCIMARRKLPCFPSKRESDEEWLLRLEQERREGRALLREMVVKSDDLDWEKVIKKADELHRKQEQKIMKKERKWQKRETRKKLTERRKADAIGSFSVNLLTMRVSDEDNAALRKWRQRTYSAAGSATSHDDSDSRATMDVSNIHSPTHVGREDRVGHFVFTEKTLLSKPSGPQEQF